MARPSKPIQLVKGHRTKAEKQVREKAEKDLLSGSSFKEWDDVKNNSIAHKEFLRVKKMFKAIKKDDALHESIINRYCLLHSECKEFEQMKLELYERLKELINQDMEFLEKVQIQTSLQDKIMQCDKKVMDKRKMMLDIEKENIMTIASVLRSIPKKVEEESVNDPMAAFLSKKQG